jgi:hypothetical protein
MNTMNKLLPLLFALIVVPVFGQIGGTTGYNFLNLPFNARVGGLGGDFITIRDSDVNLGIQNPALLNSKMHKRGSFNQGLYAGGINNGGLNYAYSFSNQVTGAAHFRYVSYGKLARTDINGADLGTFSPGDFVLGASAGKSINERMHIGATFNIIYSQLDSYVSFGNSLDIGGCYTNEDKRLVLSGVIKHLGIQWKGYNGTRSALPLEVQLGVSHKLAHAPFRFSLLGQHLERWDLSYNDPNAKETTDPLTGEVIVAEKAGFAEKLGRHFIFQTEILFGSKLHLRIAFDYNRRQELKLDSRPGVAGFSFGAGLYFKRFTLDYGILCYSSAGVQNMLSLSMPLGKQQ